MNTTITEEIWSRISSAKKILLHCHPNTDGDSVGGVLAMAQVLFRLNKEVTVIAGDNQTIPKYLSFLPTVETIIYKDFSEITLSDFDLFIILDSASSSQISRKITLTFPLTIPTIVIDHHASNKAFGDLNLIDTGAPANCQILYQLFKEWGVLIDHDIALCLFVGIYTDTGGFKFLRTSEKTFEIATSLVSLVPEFTDYLFTMENSYSPAWAAFMKIAFSNITLWYNEKVAISTISYQEISTLKINNEGLDTSGFANTLKSITGWEIGIMCTEEKIGEIKISFRTRDSKRFDVSKIAGILGGGGHPSAAGAYIKGELGTILEQVKSVIGHTYPELATFNNPSIVNKIDLHKSQ